MAKLSEMNLEQVEALITKYLSKIELDSENETLLRKYNSLLKRKKQLSSNTSVEVEKFHSSNEDTSQEKDATFVQRAVAIVIDTTLIGVFSQILTTVLSFGATMLLGAASEAGLVAGIAVMIITSFFICPYIYYVIPIEKTGQTIGKQVMKIKIVTTEPGEVLDKKKIIYREFVGKLVSSIIFMAGYLVVLFGKKAWHDNMARTRVIAL
ncbi:hypothetical protein A9Q84_12105 [Halobacteriovorax marinus]|uniref:RDD domain-containing protein n=1 Tax=Halobacteriovorax marinus TaxID=97084 RepID=A0A1Y5F837_9BACT|nr:hypothetical protein A9Q84_12105 [Halobacteriovorax marinus]